MICKMLNLQNMKVYIADYIAYNLNLLLIGQKYSSIDYRLS